MALTAFCPVCGADGIPLSDRREALADPARAIVGPCRECGATVTELRDRARHDQDWQRFAKPTLRFRDVLLVYLGALIIGVLLAMLSESQLGIAGDRMIFAWVGALFLLAATGRPWWLFDSFRFVGWFGLIQSDALTRLVLLTLGLALLAMAVFAPVA